MVNDPIADFINQLVNAGAVRKEKVTLPYSKLKHAIANLLVEEGYIASVDKQDKENNKADLEIGLSYDEDGSPRINEVKRISKPSRRMYARVSDIRPVKNGRGMVVISTPKGILSDSTARKERVGGELLFTIW